MGAIVRGVKNAFRNTVRTSGVVVILAISICLSLVMLLSLKTVQQKITDVKSSIGNTVSVSPAGIRGFEGGGELLTSADIASVSAISGVSKVSSTLSDRLTPTTDTSLQPSIEAGSFGRRMQGGESATPPSDSSATSTGSTSTGTTTRTFTMPVTLTGVSDASYTQTLGVSSLTFTSGNAIDPTKDVNEAMMGKDLATKNNLAVGQTFTIHGATVTLVGIYDTGTTFTNGGLVMSLASVQRLSAQTGAISSATVTTTSVDNLSSVQTAIKDKLGTKADVTTSEETATAAITPLENIKTISLYSLIGALAAGAIITFLTMLMIVRERRREIGVLKAIGASNWIITTQFVVEAFILTLMSSVIGIIGGFFLSNPILNALVTSSTSTGSQGGPSVVGRGGGGGFGMMRAAGQSIQSGLNNIHAVVGYDVILYGLLAAVAIAIIGSAIPAYFIAKIRPAEVMRND